MTGRHNLKVTFLEVCPMWITFCKVFGQLKVTVVFFPHYVALRASKLRFVTATAAIREVSFFTRRGGGAPENWGGDQVLCLRSKGGSKDFFKLKRGDHLYF